MKLFYFVSICLFLQTQAWPSYNAQPFAEALKARQAAPGSTGLQVDLGYSVYEGYYNATSRLSIWRGIRFAAPPTGRDRWQLPQPPVQNRTSILRANAFGPTCYRTFFATGPITPLSQTTSNEDCLFLNVWAPAGSTQALPVLVWIHGGGYGFGNGRSDPSPLINTNNNTFIVVEIQYRLGAFGFLSSDEVYRNGIVNAGLYDQHFALQWVQSYIHLFGGNASQVTIGGESAGGGAVMLQDMAFGGSQGTSLFKNIISASPFLPKQYGYKDWVPSQAYYAFASAAGCLPNLAYGSSSRTIFECLVAQDVRILQNASVVISQSGTYGTWAFLPVTDGYLVQDVPSRQLAGKRVNGRHALVGNNANEAPWFVPGNISTQAALVQWLGVSFPLFSNDDIAKILLYYPSTNDSVIPADPEFATLGYTGPTAINQSEIATGQQQRAYNIYAETTFICPSYWQAEAYSGNGRISYKYQYSIPPSLHGGDLALYFDPPDANFGADFLRAFRTSWGNFITTDNPSIASEIANGASANDSSASSPASSWPAYSIYAPYQINFNQSGGTPFEYRTIIPGYNFTVYGQPGLQNNITLHNAYTWEGGRGFRCDFWKSMGELVPE